MQIEALTELKNHSRAKLYPGNKEFYIDVFIFLGNLQWVADELENNLNQISLQDGIDKISLQVGSKYSRDAIKYINETRDRVNKCFSKETEEGRVYNDRLLLLELEDNTQEPDFIQIDGEIDLPLPVMEVALYLNRICRYFLPVFEKNVSIKDQIPLNHSLKLVFTCNSNQVYDVFRQLKNEGWISNDWKEIADFIFNNVKFDKGRNPDRDTIAIELSRNSRPTKSKRYTPPSTEQ